MNPPEAASRAPWHPKVHYRENRVRYKSLGITVEGMLKKLLRTAEIDYYTITHRTKTLASYLRKIERKAYADPLNEVMDVCGVRVVTYLEADVPRVRDLIQKEFEVDGFNSRDKAEALTKNQVGYQSVHLICTLGETRKGLREYQQIHPLKFEVQIRSALQHVWAQIEHDRNYKFGSVLPSDLERRLYLAAGLLEIADREFNELTVEIDQYAKDVKQQVASGALQAEITSESLLAYLDGRASDLDHLSRTLRSSPASQQEVIYELHEFGKSTLAEVDELLSPEYVRLTREHNEPGQLADRSFIRGAMMYDNLFKYFDASWENHWQRMRPQTVKLLRTKYSEKDVQKVIGSRKLVPEAQTDDATGVLDEE